MDFSENGSIEFFDKAQSEHCKTLRYTLFISIWSLMSADEWNKVDGKLSKYDEVTVDGEFILLVIQGQASTKNIFGKLWLLNLTGTFTE